jgi:hypothetical protein
MRLLQVGNEFYDYTADGWSIWNGVNTPTVNQPGGRKSVQGNGGKYYYYLGGNDGLYMLSHKLPNVLGQMCSSATQGGNTEIYARFAFQHNATNQTWPIMQFYNSATSLVVGYLGGATGNGSGEFLYGYNGAGTAIITTNSFILVPSQWYRIEIHFKSAASGGIFELWVNDTPWWSSSALNTSNGTTVCFDTVIIGQANATATVCLFDDMVINDTTGPDNNGRAGEGYVIAVYPTRAGTFSQFQNAFGTSAENYDHVNKPITAYTDPYNVSLYTGTNTPYQKDSYKMSTLPQELGGISAIKVVTNVARNGTAITTCKHILEPGAPQPTSAPTLASYSAGGFVTAGDHQFCVVNKIGNAWSLPSPMSAALNAGANNVININIPTAPTIADPEQTVTAREIYVSRANTDTTVDTPSNNQLFPGSGGSSTIAIVSAAAFSTLPNTNMLSSMQGLTLPQSTINVVSTFGWPSQGTLLVTTSTGLQAVNYFGVTPTSFQGCIGGTGNLLTATVAAASNTVNVSTFAGAGQLFTNQNPTTVGFAATGTLNVATSGGSAVITYTGIQTTPAFAFTGCSTVSGTGTLSTNGFIQAVASTTLGSVGSSVGVAYISNNTGLVQYITYTGTSGNTLTGCAGGFGTMATGGFVSGPLFLAGTVGDNVTTVFAFSIADSNLNYLMLPYEMQSTSPISLASGGFNYVETIFDHNPITGLPWTRDEIEFIEAGIQFTP